MPDFPTLPPVAGEPISLVLLADNAEAHLVDVVRAWASFLQGRGTAYEVLLVDDGSTDRTAALAEELAAEVPNLKLLRHEGRRGIGASLRTGFAAATHPLIASCPCDPVYPPDALPRLLAEIDRVHFLSGFRAGRRVPWPWRLLGVVLRLGARVLMGHAPAPLPGWLGVRGHLAAWLSRVFFGVRSRDVACPFRLVRKDVLARAPLQSDGEFALVELVAKLNFAGRMLGEEVPLPVSPHKARPGPRTGPRLKQILREAYRVFTRPDFGKALLPEPAPPPTAPEEPAPAAPDGLPV